MSDWIGKEISGDQVVKRLKDMESEEALISQKVELDIITDFIRCAMVQDTNVPALSQLSIVWTTPPMTAPRKKWALTSLKAKWPLMLPPTKPPPQAGFSMEEIIKQSTILADWASTKQKGKKTRKGTTENDSNLEAEDKVFDEEMKCTMLGFCGLTLNEEDKIPDIWKNMHKKTESVCQNLLTKEIQHHAKGNPKVRIALSPQLLKDIKAMHFGYENDTSVELASHGITPYCVPFRNLKQQAKVTVKEEATAQVVFTNVEDATKARTNIAKITGDYESTLCQMLSYSILLLVLFGSKCAHYVKVVQIIALMERNFQENFGLPSELASRAHLLWHVHRDARLFFSTLLTLLDLSGGKKLESELQPCIDDLKNNAPCFAQSTPTELLPAVPKPSASLAGKRKDIEDKDPTPTGAGGGLGKKSKKALANMIKRDCQHALIKHRVQAFAAKKFFVTPLAVAHAGGLQNCKDLQPDGITNLCLICQFNGKCPKRCNFDHLDITEVQACNLLDKAEPGLQKLEEKMAAMNLN